jgi:hypothetical protein
MQCRYCAKHLGFFPKVKSAFCSEQHEELYRSAAQRRLEAPYEGTLENSALQAANEAGRVQDLARLLEATQVDRGTSIETPAEVTIAADTLEALIMVASSAAAMSSRAVPETGSFSHPWASELPDHPPPAPPAIRADEARSLPDASPPIDFLFAAAPTGIDQRTDRRSEPRVDAVQAVTVATLRDPEREMTCALVNTSDTGIQFTADADFAVGEILVAELPDQLVLAEVRHVEAKDGRFAIGAERAQTMSKENALPASSGVERAELLIKALCDRVRTGFADDPAQGIAEAGQNQRERGIERVARILDIWQRTKSGPIPPKAPESACEPTVNVDQAVPAEPAPSIGAGRTFAAVASSLVIVALLMVCIVQYRKHQTVPALQTPAPVAEQHTAASPKLDPAPPPAPAPAGLHRAQITAVESTWVAVSTDGHQVFGKTMAKGATQDLEYSKFAFVHAGNAAGVEITLDGQPVPMGKQPRLRLVELNATGFRFLRWSNDDPSQP